MSSVHGGVLSLFAVHVIFVDYVVPSVICNKLTSHSWVLRGTVFTNTKQFPQNDDRPYRIEVNDLTLFFVNLHQPRN